MKRLLSVLLILCMCASLCACSSNAGSAKESAPVITEDGLYEKSGVAEDGTVFTTWRRGGPDGTPAKLVYDVPDGTHGEEYYNLDGALEHSILNLFDGSSYEVYYYPSGNIEKSIMTYADGSFEEIHFLDNGDGVNSGTVSYEKRVSADGQVNEYDNNLELMEDGSSWSTMELDDGSVMKFHYDKSGFILERYWDIPDMGKHIVEQYYGDANETKKSVETSYDNSNEYSFMEYYEDGSRKHIYMVNYGGVEGTERKEDISRQGYSTYMYLKHPASDTYEWFADENGNLQKLVKNGKVYEGNAISAEEIQNWDAIKEKPENK
ncbi:MAG: hypothetical protein IKV47_03270 [Oscillospiraceae bacterium]|nr:hypothetical protein [Oscillospiraceae bacterium]